MSIIFFVLIGYKLAHNRPEWMLLLIILSYIKTCIMYLFEATTVFTIVTIGDIQIHLDDIILLCLLSYCYNVLLHVRLRKSIYTKSILLMVIPISISLLRGILEGTIGSSDFLADARNYGLFLLAIISFFFLLRQPSAIQQLIKCEKYIHRLMSAVIVFIFIVWALDIVLGMRSLPGQINGTLSDGGSTFRIINPPQALIIAFYTLNQLYKDLKEKKTITLRTSLFILVIILLQWRTVVAVFLFAIVLLIMKIASQKELLSKRLLTKMILIIPAVAAIFFTRGGNFIANMIEKLFSSFANVWNGTGTFATRTEVWTMLLSSLSGVNVLLGRPFGAGNMANVTWEDSAHNGYVDYIMVAGYFGLICLILFMIILIIGAHKTGKEVMSIILIALLVYWYGYGFSIEQGVLLGVCLAVLNQTKKVKLRKVGGTNEP